MATTAEEVLARQIKRNVVIGIVFCFVITVAMCLPSGIGWRGAMSIALLPAGFAGPFVGGLGSVVTWVRAEDLKTEIYGAVVAQASDTPAIELFRPGTVAVPSTTPTFAATLIPAGPTPHAV